MTLRDYFAGQALASLAVTNYGMAYWQGELAVAAYEVADAMLRHRASLEKEET